MTSHIRRFEKNYLVRANEPLKFSAQSPKSALARNARELARLHELLIQATQDELTQTDDPRQRQLTQTRKQAIIDEVRRLEREKRELLMG